VVSLELILEPRVGGFLRGEGERSDVENSAATFHTATPRGPSPIFLISPSFWSLRMARCAWVLEIPARWAISRSGIAIVPLKAESQSTVQTLVTARGRWRRSDGKRVPVSRGWHLTTSARRANLLVSIRTPSQLGGNASAPRYRRGVLFSYPAVISPAFAGCYSYYIPGSIYHRQRARINSSSLKVNRASSTPSSRQGSKFYL
jgi:hypothetical protein